MLESGRAYASVTSVEGGVQSFTPKYFNTSFRSCFTKEGRSISDEIGSREKFNFFYIKLSHKVFRCSESFTSRISHIATVRAVSRPSEIVNDPFMYIMPDWEW
jgi:hypothetical protein